MRDRNAPLTSDDVVGLAWEEMGGLLPAIVQDRSSGRVLMLAYMDSQALERTLATGLATFFSRSRQRLWQKGETSGNRLRVQRVYADCDDDTLLIVADPDGPTCHLGTLSCFGDEVIDGAGWLANLSAFVHERSKSGDEKSYTRKLLREGLPRIAQKVGEEGIELALAAVTRGSEGCSEEAADLLYHLTVLMEALDFGWNEVIAVLRSRHMLNTHPA